MSNRVAILAKPEAPEDLATGRTTARRGWNTSTGFLPRISVHPVKKETVPDSGTTGVPDSGTAAMGSDTTVIAVAEEGSERGRDAHPSSARGPVVGVTLPLGGITLPPLSKKRSDQRCIDVVSENEDGTVKTCAWIEAVGPEAWA